MRAPTLPVVVSVAFSALTALTAAAPAAARVKVNGAPPGQCTPVWATVDEMLPPGGNMAAAAKVLALSSSVYVVGTTWTSDTTSSWLVRRSKEGDAWENVDDFLWGLGVSAHPDAITRDATRLYVAGGANVIGSQAGPWLVRSSTTGDTWSTVDEYEDARLPSAMAHAATVDVSGAVLVGGARYDEGAGQYLWVVRSSSDGGASWSVVDEDTPTVGATGVYGLASDPASGAVYAAGYDWDGYQYRWKVRKRSGGAWSTVDSFTLTPSPGAVVNGATPAAVTVGRNGAVFVAGTAFDANGAAHWIVRRSLDGGATWANVDDPFGGAQRCSARGMAYDSSARTLYVVGRCSDGGGYRWMVRASTNDGMSFSTIDEVAPGAGRDAWATGVDITPNGRVFVVGTVRSPSGQLRWVVRRRACP